MTGDITSGLLVQHGNRIQILAEALFEWLGTCPFPGFARLAETLPQGNLRRHRQLADRLADLYDRCRLTRGWHARPVRGVQQMAAESAT